MPYPNLQSTPGLLPLCPGKSPPFPFSLHPFALEADRSPGGTDETWLPQSPFWALGLITWFPYAEPDLPGDVCALAGCAILPAATVAVARRARIPDIIKI